MSYFRSVGVDRLRMVVEAHNKPALLFYHRLGGRGFEPYEHAGEPMIHVWFDLREPADRPAEVETRLPGATSRRSEEHTSELQSLAYLVCRLLLEKKKIHAMCDAMPVGV